MSRHALRPQTFRYPPASDGGHMRVSSRSSYPSFLSLQTTLALQLKSAWKGLHDAFRWHLVFLTIAGDAEIRSNVYKSLLLNSISLASIYAFDFILLPLVQERRTLVPRNLGWFYQTLWLLPVKCSQCSQFIAPSIIVHPIFLTIYCRVPGAHS